MSSKVEVPIEDAAVEWGKNLPLEDEKNPTTEGGGIGANLEGKEQFNSLPLQHSRAEYPTIRINNVKRLYLFDTDGTKLDLKYLKEGETVYPGAVFEFPCHIVDVGQSILKDEDAYAAIEHEPKRDVKRKRLKRKPQLTVSLDLMAIR